MQPVYLVMTFRLADDNQCQVRRVARIKVDGRGGLTFYDVQSERTEKINLWQLKFFSLLPLKPTALYAVDRRPAFDHGLNDGRDESSMLGTLVVVN